MIAIALGAAFTTSLAFAMHDSITIDKGMQKKSAVEFPHKVHAEAFDCFKCHHTAKAKEDIKSCFECHGKDASAPSVKDAFHKSCIACHKEQGKGPTKCSACHPK
jgi:hypothetical protein